MNTRILIPLLFLLVSHTAQAQFINKVQHLLEYNEELAGYDVSIYIEEIIGGTTVENAVQGNANITIAVSKGKVITYDHTTYQPIISSGPNMGTPMNWLIATEIKDCPEWDYYSYVPQLSLTGRYAELNTGDTVRLFTLFEIAGSPLCEGEVRLYDSNTDPGTSDPCASGSNLSHGMTIGSALQLYNGNLPSSQAGPTPPVVSATETNLCIGQTTELTASTDGLWINLTPDIVNLFANGTTAWAFAPEIADLVFVADDTQCISDTLSLTITDNTDVMLTGPDTICVGGATTVSSTTLGTWSSDNSAIATVNNAGEVTGVAPGSITVQFTDVEEGCQSEPIAITVLPAPTIINTGDTDLCVGVTTQFEETTGTAVTWTSSNPLVATVGSSGLVTPVEQGSTLIQATSPFGCISLPEVIIVDPAPSVSISTFDPLCVGETAQVAPTIPLGTWISSNPSIVTVSNEGVVTAVSLGSTQLIYTEAATGCEGFPLTVSVVQSDPGPDQHVRCFSTGSTYLQAQGIGIWSQIAGLPVTIDDVTAPINLIDDFPDTGDYVFEWTDGTCTATTTITVGDDCSCPLENNLIIPPATNDYCSTEAIQVEGTYEDFTGLVPNFTWEVSTSPSFETTTTVATTADLDAVIDYPSLFTSRRYYLRKVVIASELDCSDTSNVIAIDVTKSPDLDPISGSTLVCIGDAIELSVEDISNLSYQWVGPNGFSASSPTITVPSATEANAGEYSVTASRNGCFGPTEIIEVLVSDLAPAPTFADDTLCVQSVTQISPQLVLSYELDETFNGSYNNSGLYTALLGGIDSVRYRSAETGCLSEWSEPLVIIEHTMEITGDTAICIGGQTVLTSETVGTWTSSDEAVATISDAGVVTGIGVGNVTFVIADADGCQSYPSDEVTVLDCNEPCQNLNATETIVSGTAYIDTNANGLQDPTESTLANVMIAATGTGASTLTDANGYYELTLPDGSYTLTASVTGAAWVSNTVTQQLTVAGQPCIQGLSFGYELKENAPPSVELHVSSYLTRCNTEVRFYVTYQNTGSEPISGKLNLDIDDLTAYVSSVGGSVSGQLITWDVEDLQPFQPKTAQVKLLMPAPILPFPVMQFEASFTETAGNTTAPFLYESLLRCSYDPNDKAVHPARVELENKTRFSEDLLYTIRFQNNGNDTAFAVTIVDVLDENILTNSIRVRSSSHPVRTQIQEQVLTFTFPGIALVDSITNYEGSQGFVTFSCRTKDGLEENTLVTNTADIIFDTNPPIVTNTVENLMVTSICEGNIMTQETLTICAGETYAGYNSSGTYTNFLTSFEGCDSMHVINLTVVDRQDETVVIDLCPGNTALFNGQLYDQAGSYQDTIFGAAGCISVLYAIEVSDLQPVAVELDTTICEGQSLFGFTESGSYEYTISGTTDCDSIYSIGLTVLPADDPLCSVATQETAAAKQITLYPNPAKDYVRIVTELEIKKVQILSTDGSSVFAPPSIYKGEYVEVSTQDLTSGVYILSLTTGTGQVFKKLIKR